MSQLQRQGSDGSQQSLNLPFSVFSRSHMPPPAPSSSSSSSSPSVPVPSNNSFPRDYFTLRSAEPIVPASQNNNPTSSPLITNFPLQALRNDDVEASLSPKSTSNLAFLHNRNHQNQNQNQSGSQVVPHARFPSAQQPGPGQHSSMSTGTAATSAERDEGGGEEREYLSNRQEHGRDMTRSSSGCNSARRGTPDTAETTRLNSSSARQTQSQSGGKPPEQGFVPRTSSIDSAISSLSSAHSQKSSFDAGTLSSSNIDNLVNAAGSAEGVIVHLLKEKHHAESQNSQLWRLVDKQRTLVLGLNRDLERALKEKEKYKKKYRESQTPMTASSQSRPTDDSATSEKREEGQLQDPTATAPKSHKARSQSNERAAGTGIRSASDASVPSKPLRIQTNMSPSPELNTTGSPHQAVGNSPTVHDNRTVPVSAHAENPNQGGVTRHNSTPEVSSQDDSSAAYPDSAASFSSTANNSSSIEVNQDILPPPSRKPPPTPLSLQQRKRSDAQDTNMYNSDSEYEDILELETSSDPSRGRRKTREDDDMDRETALNNSMVQGSLSREEASSSLKDRSELSLDSQDGRATRSPLTDRDSSMTITESRVKQSSQLSDRLVNSTPKSPGLPLSPRPEDRPIGSPLPRMPKDISSTLAASDMPTSNEVSGLGLSPWTANQSSFSRGTHPSSLATNLKESPATPLSANNASRTIPMIDSAVKVDSPNSQHGRPGSIYQGFISEDSPDLLLPPSALPLVEVKVSSSRLRPSRSSYTGPKSLDEEPVFTLSVFSRSDYSELWRLEKVTAAVPQLDQLVRQSSAFGGKLPDRNVFSGHSPAKIDARRAALNSYFDALLNTPMDEKAAVAICRFLTSDAIEPRDDETSLVKGNGQAKPENSRGSDAKPKKEGYLTKRGKNFGGWKARYFVLHGPELKYYDSPSGPHLGTIKIFNSQIGKQSQNASGQSDSPLRGDDDSDNHYRHAFLILEPKRKDSSALVRHVLCAESDEERDDWVEALLKYVEGQSSDNEDSGKSSSKSQPLAPKMKTPYSNSKTKQPSSGNKANGRGLDSPEGGTPDTVQGFSFDDAVPAEPPVMGSSHEKHASQPTQTLLAPPTESSEELAQTPPHSPRLISGPTNGTVIQDAGAWGNKATTASKEKKRSIWGFRTRSGVDITSQVQNTYEPPPAAQLSNSSLVEKKEPVYPVFGMPLADAVRYCAPRGVDVELPAVVYRCLAYLQAKKASSEEGIFRLSGSNIVVKALKERFNTEGDVDILAGDQYYDVHAVASLFKQYLRELPTTVLTRELHLDFLRVLELNGRQEKLAAYKSLVHRLPRSNIALLRALVQFLIEIVNNSDVNKMTIRNVGIVFAPTLNIPAPVFSMFLNDFDSIFGDAPISNIEPNGEPPVLSENVRARRRQTFSEVPTHAYNRMSVHQNQIAEHPSSSQTDLTRFSSMNSYLTPNDANSRLAKAKRRESSLVIMDMNQDFTSMRDGRLAEEPASE